MAGPRGCGAAEAELATGRGQRPEDHAQNCGRTSIGASDGSKICFKFLSEDFSDASNTLTLGDPFADSPSKLIRRRVMGPVPRS